MEQLVQEYKYYLQSVKMMSPNSINSYMNDVTNYVNFLITKYEIDDMNDVTSDDIRDYLTSLKKKNVGMSFLIQKAVSGAELKLQVT